MIIVLCVSCVLRGAGIIATLISTSSTDFTTGAGTVIGRLSKYGQLNAVAVRCNRR